MNKTKLLFFGIMLLLMAPFSNTSTILADPTLPVEDPITPGRQFCFEVAGGCWIDGELCWEDWFNLPHGTVHYACYEIVITP